MHPTSAPARCLYWCSQHPPGSMPYLSAQQIHPPVHAPGQTGFQCRLPHSSCGASNHSRNASGHASSVNWVRTVGPRLHSQAAAANMHPLGFGGPQISHHSAPLYLLWLHSRLALSREVNKGRLQDFWSVSHGAPPSYVSTAMRLGHAPSKSST